MSEDARAAVGALESAAVLFEEFNWFAKQWADAKQAADVAQYGSADPRRKLFSAMAGALRGDATPKPNPAQFLPDNHDERREHYLKMQAAGAALVKAADAYGFDTLPLITFLREFRSTDPTIPGAVDDLVEQIATRASRLADDSEGDDVAPTDASAGWPTVSDVAEVLDVPLWKISRWADNCTLRDNGKQGRARRIDPASVFEYQQARVSEPAPVSNGLAAPIELEWECVGCRWSTRAAEKPRRCPRCPGATVFTRVCP
jgi:hypothetical protein